MTISSQQVKTLLSALAYTRDEEESCDGCLKMMAEFAEQSLVGKTVTDSMRAIDHHLRVCGECREEFEALKVALSCQEF